MVSTKLGRPSLANSVKIAKEKIEFSKPKLVSARTFKRSRRVMGIGLKIGFGVLMCLLMVSIKFSQSFFF